MAHVSLAIAGDVMLGRLMNEALHKDGPAAPWTAVRGLWKDDHAFFYNLECAIAGNLPMTEPEKTFHFRMDPSFRATLQESRVDAVSLANNHLFDYGEAGFLETLEHLDTMGVARAGAGKDREEALRPVVLEKNKSSIALIAASDHPRHWSAEADQSGIFLVDPAEKKSVDDMRRSIQQAREMGADLIVVSLHWGPNMQRHPMRHHPWFARKLLDAGAHVVWGTSAHLFQAIEFYHDGVILYDTGDFLDDYAVHRYERNDQSFLFHVDTEDGAIQRVRLDPVVIANRRTLPADPETAGHMGALMAELSAPYGTRMERAERGYQAVAV